MEIQEARNVFNTNNMNILPTITDSFSRDKSVEVFCANKEEKLDGRKVNTNRERGCNTVDAKVQKAKLSKIIIFGAPLPRSMVEKINRNRHTRG